MSEKNVKFKNALGGYNKKDVNEYLAAVSAEMRSREEINEVKRERLERQVEDERTAKEIIRAQLDELGFELYEANARETELKNAVTGLTSRVAELEAELAKKTDEANLSSDELDKISEIVGIETEESDGDLDTAQKAAIYDKLSERIGEIMLKADSNAEQIMTGAMERSDEMISNAQKDSDALIKAAEAEAASIREHYKNIVSAYYEEVAAFVSDIREAISSFIGDIGAKSAELEGRLDYLGAANLPKKEEITGSCTEKETEPEQKEKKTYSSIEEKIEGFFKKTMAALNAFKGKK